MFALQIWKTCLLSQQTAVWQNRNPGYRTILSSVPHGVPVQYVDAISSDEGYNDTHNIPTISKADLRDIASIRYPDLDFSEESIPTEVVQLAINAICSNATTPEELSLGHFTRFKLKRLSTWDQWQAGKHKQLDQFD